MSPHQVSAGDDTRQGVSEAAHRALDELELMDVATDPAKLIGQAMASVEAALATTSNTGAASACTMAAARLIRAAELLEEQYSPDAPGPDAPGLEQAGEGAGSEPAPLPLKAGPSPSPAEPSAPIDHSLGLHLPY